MSTTISSYFASFFANISSFFGGKRREENAPSNTGYEPRSRQRLATPAYVSGGDCKCINCQREFNYEDFIGLCTSKECASESVFRENLHATSIEYKFNPEVGPRQILLREQTRQTIKTIVGDYDIADVAPPGEGNKCPACSSHFYFYACPHCRHPMPRVRKEIFDHMIAPAGIGTSGKSIYMTMLLQVLRSQPITKAPLSMTSRFSSNADTQRFMENYDTLVKYKQILSSNQLQVPSPYLVITTTKNDSLPVAERKKDAYTVWYDFSGEMFKSDTSEQHFSLNYFASVKGLLLFVDPTNSPEVVSELGLVEIDNSPIANENNDLNMWNQIQSVMGARSESALDNAYVAVIVNKIDLFKNASFDFFHPFSHIWRPSSHRMAGGFVQADHEKISEEVEGYLQKYHSALYGNLQGLNREMVGYFGVSALGSPLVNGEIVEDVKPLRVEDPFYWLLWKFGHLPAVQ